MAAVAIRNFNILRYLSCLIALAGGAGALVNSGYGIYIEIFAVMALFLLLGFILEQLMRSRRRNLDLECQLVQAQRVNSLDEMSAGIAHEINNPLNIIMQEAEIIRVHLGYPGIGPFANDIDESLEVIMNQVRRCSEVTGKLLDMARNRLTVTQKVDVNKLLRDLLILVDEDVAGKKIRIIRRISSNPLYVYTDPPLLRQVFLNLFKNAVQAVGRKGEIIISSRLEDEKVVIAVADNGPGIAEANIPHIFTPFFTTKSPGEGTGIGLAVSLRIINQLGGTIDVESVVGRGTVFSVAIPANRMRSS
ncbi:ATP-binding protein [Maridesulfovibrio sp.]|uniref:sensor histidine kinase n=1 Tax=Maridesulfovibrio sp. TaxID=2795000 RepID=UPI0029F58E5E|nr:ATP-binding protein [Maridesulfovibrio sp.]